MRKGDLRPSPLLQTFGIVLASSGRSEPCHAETEPDPQDKARAQVEEWDAGVAGAGGADSPPGRAARACVPSAGRPRLTSGAFPAFR